MVYSVIMWIIWHDLLLLFLVWLMLLFWQLAAFPFLHALFSKKLIDAGWAFGRLTSWLVIATVVWFLAHAHLAVNTQLWIWLFFIIWAFVAFRYFEKHKLAVLATFKQAKKLIITQEILFAIGLIFLFIVRGFNPAILDLEKFMDAGLMVSYMKSPQLPLEDMWLAGEKVNYYTFGHFLGAVALNFLNLKIEFGYNVLLAVIMGLIMSQGACLASNLMADLNKKKLGFYVIFAGILASLLLAFGGNTHAIWYLLKNRSFVDFWYPDSTRFIERTIHEFPAYSFIVSDLHAHLWSLPIVLFLLLNIYTWLKALLAEKKVSWSKLVKQTFWQQAVVVGAIFGLIVGTSAWDVAIYALLLGIIGLVLLFLDFVYLPALLVSAFTIGVSMVLVSSPWWLNFVSISEGVKVAYEHSPLWQLLVLWTGHVSMTLLSLFLWLKMLYQFAKKKLLAHSAHLVLLIAMILTAWILIVIPELIYVKDIYPNHPRANTMFKLTFQSLTLMSVVAAVFIAYLAQFKAVSLQFSRDAKEKFTLWLKKMFKQVLSWKFIVLEKKYLALLPLKLLSFLFVLAVLLYPYFGYRDYYGLKEYKGVNGLAWLAEKYPADYQAIVWLNNYVVGRPVIVEAVGESYTTFARVSTFTGFPTILGWRVHEWLWRGGFEIPGARTEEVRKIYEEPLSPDSQRLLAQYQVQYIIVGDKEREAYTKLDEAGLAKLGKKVFAQAGTYILAL